MLKYEELTSVVISRVVLANPKIPIAEAMINGNNSFRRILSSSLLLLFLLYVLLLMMVMLLFLLLLVILSLLFLPLPLPLLPPPILLLILFDTYSINLAAAIQNAGITNIQ